MDKPPHPNGRYQTALSTSLPQETDFYWSCELQCSQDMRSRDDHDGGGKAVGPECQDRSLPHVIPRSKEISHAAITRNCI